MLNLGGVNCKNFFLIFTMQSCGICFKSANKKKRTYKEKLKTQNKPRKKKGAGNRPRRK